MSESNEIVNKTCSTLFPMGVGIREAEDNIYILEFLDLIGNIKSEESLKIVGSFALSKKKIVDLMDSLKSIIEDEKSDDRD